MSQKMFLFWLIFSQQNTKLRIAIRNFLVQYLVILKIQKCTHMPLSIQYQIHRANTPIWAFAIHDGHEIANQLLPYLQLDEQGRLREEDPFTAEIANLPVNLFIVSTSRFQLDLNRKEADALYLRPDQAWGLNVWKKDLPEDLVQDIYKAYQDTYQVIDHLIEATIQQFGEFLILDIHSYNAKRTGADEVIDSNANPQINLGTYYNHPKWRTLTESFIQAIEEQRLSDSPIDIRENIKFKGGYLSQHLNKKYGEKGAILSVEFRKDFMDEWTGEPYPEAIQACNNLLAQTLPRLQAELTYDAR